jgi:hypothetical protein
MAGKTHRDVSRFSNQRFKIERPKNYNNTKPRTTRALTLPSPASGRGEKPTLSRKREKGSARGMEKQKRIHASERTTKPNRREREEPEGGNSLPALGRHRESNSNRTIGVAVALLSLQRQTLLRESLLP